MLQPDLSYDPMATDDLVTQFITDCRRRELTLATQAGYLWALDRLIRECPDLPRTPWELAPVLDDPGLAQESRRQLLKVLRIFYRWCVQECGAANPAELLRRIPSAERCPGCSPVKRFTAWSTWPAGSMMALPVVRSSRITGIAPWC